MQFDKQVSREQYHEAFIQKMEEHKVPSNTYNAKFSQTRQRAKVTSLGPDSYASRNRMLHQSVNITPNKIDESMLLGSSLSQE